MGDVAADEVSSAHIGRMGLWWYTTAARRVLALPAGNVGTPQDGYPTSSHPCPPALLLRCGYWPARGAYGSSYIVSGY